MALLVRKGKIPLSRNHRPVRAKVKPVTRKKPFIMQKRTDNTKNLTAKALAAAALLSLSLFWTSLPAHAQTDHAGTGRTREGATTPKGATTDKGTYTTVDTVGRKAGSNQGSYGNTRDLEDGKQGGAQDTTRTRTSTQGNRTGSYGNTSSGTGLPLDTTRQEGGQYGNTGTTGTRPRQDTTGREGGAGNAGTGTGRSGSGPASDTIGGGSKASYESGSRTNDGSQLNRNRTKTSGTGKKN